MTYLAEGTAAATDETIAAEVQNEPRYFQLTQDQRKVKVRNEYRRLIKDAGKEVKEYSTLALETFMLFRWRDLGWITMVADTTARLGDYRWDREW